MTLYQLGSYSKDGLHLACLAYVTAVILRVWSGKQITHLRTVWFFLLALVIAVLARPQYYALSFLVFLLPSSSHQRKYWTGIAVKLFFLLGLAALIYVLLSQNVYSADSHSLQQAPLNVHVYPEAQLAYLLNNPLALPFAFWKTMGSDLAFFLSSMIGQFGWLDYQLSWFVYIVYAVIISSVLFLERNNFPSISWRRVSILILVLLGCISGLSVAFYLYGTSVGSEKINGLQGRYFIPLLSFLVIICCELWQKMHRNILRGVFALMLISICWVSVMRYFKGSDYTFVSEEVQLYQNYSPILVEHSYQEKFNGITGRELRGVVLMPTFEQYPSTRPYQILIKDQSCQKLLSSQLIDISKLKFNDTNQVLFPKVQSGESYCLEIKPYYYQILEPNHALQLKRSNENSILFGKIYLN